jgi:hypothetical protein
MHTHAAPAAGAPPLPTPTAPCYNVVDCNAHACDDRELLFTSVCVADRRRTAAGLFEPRPSPEGIPRTARDGETRRRTVKIYVGNLSYDTMDADLRAIFEKYGAVDSCSILMDRETGRSRGFAFVEMSDASAAQNAMRELDGTELHGRNLKVNEAKPRPDGGGRGPGGGGGRRRF